MQSWFDSVKVDLLNHPKVHTKIDPATEKGSTLDLAVITPGLRSSVVHFKVDKRRQWSLHGTVTDKGRWSHSSGRMGVKKRLFQLKDMDKIIQEENSTLRDAFTKPKHLLQSHALVSSIVFLYEMLKEFS